MQIPWQAEQVLSSRRFVTSNMGASDIAFTCAVCSAIVADLAQHYGWAEQVQPDGPHRRVWIEACRQWPEPAAPSSPRFLPLPNL